MRLSQPPMISDGLRRETDKFIALDKLCEAIGRSPREPREDRISGHPDAET